MDFLRSPCPQGKGKKMDLFLLKESILFRRDPDLDVWQVVIPGVLSKNIIDGVHSKLGHPKIYKTRMYIRRFYYWKSMSKEIKKFVLPCDLCQRVKSPNVKMTGAYRRMDTEEPCDLVSVDFYGPLSKSTGRIEYVSWFLMFFRNI